PRRGEFFIMDKEAPYKLRHIILPVPTRISKGILISPTVSGNLLVGPTAEDIEDKSDTRVTVAGLAQVMTGAQKLLPALSSAHTITQYAGLRPVRHPEGYTVEASRQNRGYIGISGVRSTGVTSAPAVAAYVRDLAEEVGLKLIPRSNFNPLRRQLKPFASMTYQERAAAIKVDPHWGHVVCRCEHVTEAEVLRAIHSPLGARSLDAIKRRTRAGMGRCQGGFCGVRIPFILARELGIPVEAVTKKGPGSEILVGPIRGEMMR
ncbi:glycerol-3-phosphate dehydrogenase, partial [Candidatus Hakubella thermalkaliphila]